MQGIQGMFEARFGEPLRKEKSDMQSVYMKISSKSPLSRSTVAAAVLTAVLSAPLPAAADGERSSYSYGYEAEATGDRAFAIGVYAKALGKQSLAIGAYAQATGGNSLAIGRSAKAVSEGVAIGNQANAGYQSTAIGMSARAQGTGSAAVGTEASAPGDYALAFGAGASASGNYAFAFGTGAKASASNCVAIGSGSEADQADTISVGSSSITRRITHVAAGTADADAVNKGQLDAVEAEAKKHATVTAGDKNIDLASGTNGTGGIEYTLKLADDISVKTVTTDSLKVNGKAYITADGISANGQTVTNVAAGTLSAESTDAVNGSQLFATNQQVDANSNSIKNLWKKSGDLNRKINRTGANAAALAALHPLDYDEDHKVSGSVGIGQYHGTGALAVGVFIRPTENLMFSLGGSFASEDRMFNAGMSYRFGDDGSDKYISKADMVTKVNTLTAENRDLTAQLTSANTKLDAANARIDDLTAKIQAIEAKLANLK